MILGVFLLVKASFAIVCLLNMRDFFTHLPITSKFQLLNGSMNTRLVDLLMANVGMFLCIQKVKNIDLSNKKQNPLTIVYSTTLGCTGFVLWPSHPKLTALGGSLGRWWVSSSSFVTSATAPLQSLHLLGATSMLVKILQRFAYFSVFFHSFVVRLRCIIGYGMASHTAKILPLRYTTK